MERVGERKSARERAIGEEREREREREGGGEKERERNTQRETEREHAQGRRMISTHTPTQTQTQTLKHPQTHTPISSPFMWNPLTWNPAGSFGAFSASFLLPCGVPPSFLASRAVSRESESSGSFGMCFYLVF